MYEGYNSQRGYLNHPNVINNSGDYNSNKQPSNNSSWQVDCSSGWCISVEKGKKGIENDILHKRLSAK